MRITQLSILHIFHADNEMWLSHGETAGFPQYCGFRNARKRVSFNNTDLVTFTNVSTGFYQEFLDDLNTRLVVRNFQPSLNGTRLSCINSWRKAPPVFSSHSVLLLLKGMLPEISPHSHCSRPVYTTPLSLSVCLFVYLTGRPLAGWLSPLSAFVPINNVLKPRHYFKVNPGAQVDRVALSPKEMLVTQRFHTAECW